MVAPNAFKGSLSPVEAAEAMAEGVRRAWPGAEVVRVPVADGGDGTLEALVAATGGCYRTARVTGPLGEPVTARWGVLGDGRTAVIETAQACGLARVPPERRDPLRATTYGVGELVRAALDAGFRRILLGLGGSATQDGGAGLAQALGIRLLDDRGRDLPPGAEPLLRLERVDLSGRDPRISESEILVAVDVTNPLTGPRGSAAVYGPQKGAAPEAIPLLDRALARLAAVVRRDLGKEVETVPGAGAAGGMGAGLMAFLDARPVRGADLVLDTVDLDARLEGAHLVLTGEGRVDRSTAFHKAPAAVARRARRRGIPVLLACGSLGEGYEAVYEEGVTGVYTLVPGPFPPERAMAEAGSLLAEATERALRLLGAGARLAGHLPGCP